MPTKSELAEQQIRMAEEMLFSGKRLPSFVKGLFFGLIDAERLFPFPHPEAEEHARAEILVSELKTFCDAHLDPAAIDRNAEIPKEVIDGLGRLGVFGCTVPKEYGGEGLTQHTYCRLVEELSRRCGATALFTNVQQSIGLKSLLLFGTEKQKKRWLPPLSKAEVYAAFALTEPNAGSDAAGVQTRAVHDPDRNIYVINGEKQWITNGSIAQMLTVMAQTEVDTPRGKEDRITAFLVTPDMPGFRVTTRALEKVGHRGSITAKLAFENMEVPAENIIGPKGSGLRVALTVLDFGRTTFGAMCTGSAKELVERAIAHAQTREQFGRPIAGFELVKEKIATMSALVYAMESVTYLTAGLLDKGEEDFMLETAMIKVFTSEAQWRIQFDTMQILGGRSLFTDAPYERMMRDARLNMIGEGSNDVLRVFMAAVGLRDVGMQLKDVQDAAKNPLTGMGAILGFGKKSLEKVLHNPAVPVDAPELAGEGAQLAASVRKFGLTNQKLLMRYREGIVEKQMVLNRLSTAAMALYTVSAVLSRMDTALADRKGQTGSLETDVVRGKLYCKMAFADFDQAMTGLQDNFDDDIVDVANRLTGVE